MAIRKYKCKVCGEEFTPTKEEAELHEYGFCSLPDVCEDCYSNSDYVHEEQDYRNPSDADPGL